MAFTCGLSDMSENHMLMLIWKHCQDMPEKFHEWLVDNHHVYYAFVKEAFKVKGAGFKHYSARTIIHVLRHHSAISETGGEWKINNNYSPYLARLVMREYPEFEGFFDLRRTFS